MSEDMDEDLVKMVAHNKAGRQMEDFIADFENRISVIRDAKKEWEERLRLNNMFRRARAFPICIVWEHTHIL